MSRNSHATNHYLIELIKNLKKTSLEHQVKIWKAIATELEKPARIRRVVNLYHINHICKENDVIVVPGKVLGIGDINKKLTVSAFSFSDNAREKINKNGKTVSIEELLKTNPKGAHVRIVG